MNMSGSPRNQPIEEDWPLDLPSYETSLNKECLNFQFSPTCSLSPRWNVYGVGLTIQESGGTSLQNQTMEKDSAGLDLPSLEIFSDIDSWPSSPDAFSPPKNFLGNNQESGGSSYNILSPHNQTREEEMKDWLWVDHPQRGALFFRMCPTWLSRQFFPWNLFMDYIHSNRTSSSHVPKLMILSHKIGCRYLVEASYTSLKGSDSFVKLLFPKRIESAEQVTSVDLKSINMNQEFLILTFAYGKKLDGITEDYVGVTPTSEAPLPVIKDASFVDPMLVNLSQELLLVSFAYAKNVDRKHMKITEDYVDVIPTLEGSQPVIETLNDEREPNGGSIQQASENRSVDKRSLCEDELRPSGEFVRTNACPADDGKMCDSGNNFHNLENCQKEQKSKKKNVKGEKPVTKEQIQELLHLKQVDAAKKLGMHLSTLKRRRIAFGMGPWSSKKKRAGTDIEVKCADISGSCSEPNEGDVPNSTGYECVPNSLDTRNQGMPLSCSPLEVHEKNQSPPNMRLATDEETTKTKQCESADNGLGGASESLRPDGSSNTFIVKAEYKEDTIRLILWTYSVAEMMEEVQKRLNLEVGKFKIKYKDEEEEWVLVTCDSDLEHALCVSRSSGAKVPRLLIHHV